MKHLSPTRKKSGRYTIVRQVTEKEKENCQEKGNEGERAISLFGRLQQIESFL